MQKKTQRPPVKKQVTSKNNAGIPGIRNFLFAAIAISAVVLAFFVQYVWLPQQGSQAMTASAVVEISPVSGVRINEIMGSNKRAFVDDQGDYSDWIELVNTSNSAVDITGWTITDDMNKELRFAFPSMVLEPGEFVIVFASKNLRATPGYAFHAPFKIGAAGDSVLLFDANGSIMESVNIPTLSSDQVYMRSPDTGEWTISNFYTPGLPNTIENYHASTSTAKVQNNALFINEVMAENKSYAPDEDGEYMDWIELYNSGNSSINLNGYCLSDDEAKPNKWKFPDVTIGAGQYMLVYASGKDRRVASGNLHMNFKLNAEGETLLLTNSAGQTLDRVRFDNLRADRSMSRQSDGAYTVDMAPTPGMPNTRDSVSQIDGQFMNANSTGLYITEAMASARQAEAASPQDDWLELYNASDRAIDLEGFGLSDDPSRPRKWQFPAGASIASGQYLQVALSGSKRTPDSKAKFHTDFAVGFNENEVLTLCTPDGAIIDRMPMFKQRASIAYGRRPGGSGFFYLETPTPGNPNEVKTYTAYTENVVFSKNGGLYNDGTISVELSAQPGAVIRYTLDFTEPNETSPVYTGPLSIYETTIVRARAFSDGEIPSFTNTQSYLFEAKHTMPVISLVCAPDDLYSDARGIMAMGPNALREYPYGSKGNGANFWMEWERAANIEMFDPNGEAIISQGVGVAMQGAYSRAEAQKAFFVTARNVYSGDNRFYGKLFPNRDYTEYKSFVLRGSGQDGPKSRMRDSLLTTLAEGTGVMYQDTRLVVAYINGEYYGQYNMRERNHKYAVAQFMGWTDVNAIDLVKANTNTLQGSNETFATMLEWLKKNGCKTEENLRRVAEVVDIDNYLNYIAIEMYVGNTDTLNVKRYRSTEGDGKWRWILFDLDWAMYTDTNSFQRWLNPKGMGNGLRTNNTLFVELMKNPQIYEKFLTLLGELMATNFDKDVLIAKIEARREELLPEMPMHQERFGRTMQTWERDIKTFKDYAEERPRKLLTYIRQETKMSTEEMRKYFGVTMDKLGL